MNDLRSRMLEDLRSRGVLLLARDQREGLVDAMLAGGEVGGQRIDVSAADWRDALQFLDAVHGANAPLLAATIVGLMRDPEAWLDVLEGAKAWRERTRATSAEDAEAQFRRQYPVHNSPTLVECPCGGRGFDWFAQAGPASAQNGTFWCDGCGARILFDDRGAYRIVQPSDANPAWAGHDRSSGIRTPEPARKGARTRPARSCAILGPPKSRKPCGGEPQ